MDYVPLLMISFGTVCVLAGYILGCYVMSRTDNTGEGR
jgi:hypothetical protein